MEKFNKQEYRDNLAKNLKEIRKTDPEKAQIVLSDEKTTKEYEEALLKSMEEKQINKIDIDSLLGNLSFKGKETSPEINKKEDRYEFLKNKEDWSTKYSTMRELNISLERMNKYMIEYKKKEPDFIVTNKLNGRTYIYKSLVEEIKDRISNGESEKIIPEGWITLQEFSEGKLLNMKLEYPADVIKYLFKEDKEIRRILYSDFDILDKAKVGSNKVLKKGKDLYWSPEFFKLLQDKISKLEKVEVAPEAKTFNFLVHYCFEFADNHKISKAEAYRIFKLFNTEYEKRKITKILNNQLVSLYPPDAQAELERRLLELK